MGRENKKVDKSVLKNNVTIKNVANTLDQDFIPPDGGWGWIIVLAAGISQFCLLNVQQSFGLLFRDRFQQLGITSSEVTIILNVNLAMISFIGLANGVIFRKFSFRKVAFFGSLINALSIAILSIVTSFYGILMCLSIFYSAGLGITISANSLALNTYFKKNRRIAIGLCWTCTGLGPIIIPQIITILLPIYGVPGTVLIFSGIALNAVACALLLQPVAWHAKNISLVDEIMSEAIKDNEMGYLTNEKQKEAMRNSEENIARIKREKSLGTGENRMSYLFSSQYFYPDENEEGAVGIDVISTPATPMMSRANDGWFSKQYLSTSSLGSNKILKRENSQNLRHVSLSLSKAPSIPILNEINRVNSMNKINRLLSETDGRNRKISNQQSVPLLIVNEATEDQINIDNDETKNNEWKMDNNYSMEVSEITNVQANDPRRIRKWRKNPHYFLDLLLR
ncbi:hypothetical protein PV328_003636 [Microctonus aethiopoides]|uniref:Uncharacterized protein n=1 Tax=Microctonus aethiopoides TaxID=144406 RepID=A0AA39KKS2_9HYME|nr:hypothetical protein PV328_003636 [Microctonus aethiopoides]